VSLPQAFIANYGLQEIRKLLVVNAREVVTVLLLSDEMS